MGAKYQDASPRDFSTATEKSLATRILQLEL